MFINNLKNFFKKSNIKVTRSKLSPSAFEDGDFMYEDAATLEELITVLKSLGVNSIGIRVLRNNVKVDTLTLDDITKCTTSYFVPGFEETYKCKLNDICEPLFTKLNRHAIVSIYTLELTYIDDKVVRLKDINIGCTVDEDVEHIIYFNDEELFCLELYLDDEYEYSERTLALARLHEQVVQDLYMNYDFLHTVLFPIIVFLLSFPDFITTHNTDYNKRNLIYGRLINRNKLILGYDYGLDFCFDDYKGLLVVLHTKLDHTKREGRKDHQLYSLALRRLLTYIHKTYRNYCMNNGIEKGSILSQELIDSLSNHIIDTIYAKLKEEVGRERTDY